MDKSWDRLGSFLWSWLDNQSRTRRTLNLLRLKIELESHPARSGGFGKYMQVIQIQIPILFGLLLHFDIFDHWFFLLSEILKWAIIIVSLIQISWQRIQSKQ